MPTYLVERAVVGAGSLTPDELDSLVGRTSAAAADLTWLWSVVTDRGVYCLVEAGNEASVRDHARRRGLPITSITAVQALARAQLADLARSPLWNRSCWSATSQIDLRPATSTKSTAALTPGRDS